MDRPHLNSHQVRAQTIKEELKNVDPDHLQTFLAGISDPEPPDYRLINGKVVPELTQVKLKEDANRFQVGNVHLADRGIVGVRFDVEDGEIQAYELDPIPKDDGNPLSAPIPDFVMMDLLPLWKAKYEQMERRMRSINDVRAYAHSVCNQPEPSFTYGKSFAKLIPGYAEPNAVSKRLTGDPISRHPSNKRKRIGLDSIPNSVKSNTFTSIPEHFKVELFDMVARSAFPGFNNLVMAAWNVVCIYENVGTEFPEFHKSITDMKSVLQELDAAHRKDRKASRLEENVGLEQNGGGEGDVTTPVPIDAGSVEAVQDEHIAGPAHQDQARDMQPPLETNSHEHPRSQYESRTNDLVRYSSTPPPVPTSLGKATPTDNNPEPRPFKTSTLQQTYSNNPSPNPNPKGIRNPTPDEQKRREEIEARIKATQAETRKLSRPGNSASPPYSELGNFYQNRQRGGRSDYGSSNGRPTNNTPSGRPVDGPVYLGNSSLGPKKNNTQGAAPVAPMIHTIKKEQNGQNGQKKG